MSLDELVKGEKPAAGGSEKSEFLENISKTVFTDRNKLLAKKLVKAALIILGVLMAVEIVVFIVSVCIYGFEGLNMLG